jgi:hypothetical protein
MKNKIPKLNYVVGFGSFVIMKHGYPVIRNIHQIEKIDSDNAQGYKKPLAQK